MRTGALHINRLKEFRGCLIMKTKIQWKPLLVSVAISLGVGILSSLFTPNIAGEYAAIPDPPLAPPAWLFPVVWTILYILMGIAAYLIWESAPGEEKRSALLYYGAQLVINFFWPLIFFRMDAYVTAFFWLLLLWYLVFVTFQKFYAINPTAGKLLIPYLVWLTFAGYLNLYIAIATL